MVKDTFDAGDGKSISYEITDEAIEAAAELGIDAEAEVKEGLRRVAEEIKSTNS